MGTEQARAFVNRELWQRLKGLQPTKSLIGSKGFFLRLLEEVEKVFPQILI